MPPLLSRLVPVHVVRAAAVGQLKVYIKAGSQSTHAFITLLDMLWWYIRYF